MRVTPSQGQSSSQQKPLLFSFKQVSSGSASSKAATNNSAIDKDNTSSSIAPKLPLPPQWLVNASAGFGDGISLGLTQWVREKLGTDHVVNESSDAYRASSTAGTMTLYYLYSVVAGGKELPFGKNFRISLLGNRTGRTTGEIPHYHRRGDIQPNGEPIPGQGMKRHRPWDKKADDTSFWDRF